jgi:ABC-2 type transport system ATP-binding protein
MTGPVLVAQALRKSFGRRKVLQGASFSVAAGTLVGIAGENGCGKSTLLRILAGELRPDHGQVLRRGAMGYCPQTVILNEALTVEQHLDFFGAAYNISDLRPAYELLEKLNYGAYRNERAGNLSAGTKQKLNLTLALIHHPRVLLLDEPYQGFDWETYLRFWKIAVDLRAAGCAILVISHLFFDRGRFDMLYRLQDGRLLIQERTEDQPEHEAGGKDNERAS